MGTAADVYQTAIRVTLGPLIPRSHSDPAGLDIPSAAVFTPLPGQGTKPFHLSQCRVQSRSCVVEHIPSRLERQLILLSHHDSLEVFSDASGSFGCVAFPYNHGCFQL